MIRARNIGRISALILFLNAIFLLVYLADKNDVGLKSEPTQQVEVVEEEVQTEMIIYMDETVDGEYVTMLENIISDQKFKNEDISTVRSYEWYLTDNINIAGADRYFIKDNEIVIFAADDDFVTYVKDILDVIITEQERTHI